MASFTITEKGYSLTAPNGQYLGVVEKDIEGGPEQPGHAMSIAASLAYKRYLKGAYPMTFVSMDNCSHNGDKLRNGMLTIAKEWASRGRVEEGFMDYLENEQLITFPLSMIDKITPRPSETVQAALLEQGIGGMDVIVTSRNTYTAPFVNEEISEYLVIEDKFTNGRPPLEEAGMIFTDRDTVNNIETMKVTTCLNPLHTALAVSGCLLGYTLIADEMKDHTLRKFAETIGYREGLPVVVDPGIGFDTIGDGSFADSLYRLLDGLDRTNELPRTIFYNLNAGHNDVLAAMAGSFQGSGIKGKIQFGSGWWYNDQKDGMIKQMTSLSNLGLLSCFIGMLTDSRSFLSYTRHEYFRRILCNLIGGWVKSGEAPGDLEFLGRIVQDICYRNAREYFQFPLSEA